MAAARSIHLISLSWDQYPLSKKICARVNSISLNRSVFVHSKTERVEVDFALNGTAWHNMGRISQIVSEIPQQIPQQIPQHREFRWCGLVQPTKGNALDDFRSRTTSGRHKKRQSTDVVPNVFEVPLVFQPFLRQVTAISNRDNLPGSVQLGGWEDECCAHLTS